MEHTNLEEDLKKEMMDLHHKIQEAIGQPLKFRHMLTEVGALETARRLINAKELSPGFIKLLEKGHLDLTIESLIYENTKWHPLFDDQTIDNARKRLKQYKHPFRKRSAFYEWMINSGLSESSAMKYSNAIEGPLSEWARESKIIEDSILSIKNQSHMSAAVLEIKKLPIFIDRDATGHQMYSSALKKYSRYLYDVKDEEDDLEKDIQEIISNSHINETEKTRLVSARIGQGKYRQDLLELWDGCSITGYSDVSFLVASHIKPWRNSNDIERLDKFNGLLLLPNLDKVFDKGFISFDSTGNILISDMLQQIDLLGIKKDMRIRLSKEHLPYLDHHRMHVFKKRKKS